MKINKYVLKIPKKNGIILFNGLNKVIVYLEGTFTEKDVLNNTTKQEIEEMKKLYIILEDNIDE